MAPTTAKGTLVSICEIYESTLRFLSLAYELVSGAFLDLAEADKLDKGNTGSELYQELVQVFIQIGSPFAKYQEHFVQLEANHLKVKTTEISKEIRQVVGNVSGLESLQTATDRLRDLAPAIFGCTEGSLDRFELLNGGYRVDSALHSVDRILGDHIGELVISVRTLSAAMTSDIDQLASVFDEQHVLCAMEVLKLAGCFRQDLADFEAKTKDRLTVMVERMMAHDKMRDEVEGASDTKTTFSLPDSMSVVEIDSSLARIYAGRREETDSNETNVSLDVLQRFAALHDSRYPHADDALQRYANSCQAFVFDVCSAVPRKHLAGMSDLAAWGEGSTAEAMDSYGTLPQQYITLVGEHMLALVQALEPFAADPETLSLANQVMGGVREVAIQPWREFTSAAGVMASDDTIALLMNGVDIAHLVLHNAALTEEDAELEEGIGDDERASAAFCNMWLDVVGLAVTGRLLERIMRIPKLTPKGCDHVAADLNYLINVFSALGVAGHPHPLVSHLAALANLGGGDLTNHITTRNRSDDAQAALRAIEVRVALLRGVSVN